VSNRSLLVLLALAPLLACGSTSRSSYSSPDAPAFSDGGAGSLGQAACVGLACKRALCSDGNTTTLTGKVYDPAGATPLYGAVVYIPRADGPLPAIASSLESGVACDQCAARAVNPLVSALTNTRGEFVLTDVPMGEDVPVVVQIGKWRRVVSVPVKKDCRENAVAARTLRLPKNGAEGDMPHIAVTSGGCDALECLLRAIGVDEREFVAGEDPSGHVHVFAGDGGTDFAGAPPAASFWNDAQKLQKYDVAMLSCECGEHNENKGGEGPGARGAMVDYANAGGRVFATHFHYTWFKSSPEPAWRNVASWAPDNMNMTSGMFDVDTSFPKGAAFADWLLAVNASPAKGTIELKEVMESLTSVNGGSQSWIKKSASAVRYFSFNTPVDESPSAQCGRSVFSDLHVMGRGAVEFPASCPGPGALSPQQKALEYLFFDLSACVQSDDTPPAPPR
jgi:hypothetical protein